MFDLQRFAVIRENETSKLTIKVATGTTARGGISYSSRNVSNISPTASDANLLSFATSYGALQAHELGSIIRTVEAELVEDE